MLRAPRVSQTHKAAVVRARVALALGAVICARTNGLNCAPFGSLHILHPSAVSVLGTNLIAAARAACAVRTQRCWFRA